jgi:hypothetical protein
MTVPRMDELPPLVPKSAARPVRLWVAVEVLVKALATMLGEPVRMADVLELPDTVPVRVGLVASWV